MTSHTRYFILYSGTTPLLTILHSVIDLILYFTLRLHPIYALTISLIFLAGWATQIVFWASCDLDGAWYEHSCYQMNLQRTPQGGDIIGVSTPLGDAKVTFAIFMLCL